MFFEEFFSKRGENIQPNHQHEVMVRCPFPHDKGGEEQNASASFNIKRRIYKCFTCEAEGREAGLSETAFISRVFETDYESAIELKKLIIKGGAEGLYQSTLNLLQNENYMKYLTETRGLHPDTIHIYRLGYTGSGIIYPVLINGMLMDTRTYNPDPEPGEPKIKSRPQAKALLFPYDEWIKDNRPTILTAGENDTLLGRQNGFNCVETTLGEGSIPHALLKKFKGKTVYICYDCDDAGKKASKKMAFYLKNAEANVFIVSLGLDGTKQDKDLTDYFLKHKKTPQDFQYLIDTASVFTDDDFIEEKNKEFPLVDLWNVKQSRYSEKYISCRVMQSGHFEIPMIDIPSHVEYECMGSNENSIVCQNCPIYNNRRPAEGEWTLNTDNLGDVLELVEVNKIAQQKAIKKICHIPDKCPNSRTRTIAKKHVEKVIFSPDVETESEATGFRMAEFFAYVLDGDTDDGNKYRIFFKRFPHPKDQSLIMVVDRVEDSDNAVNSFKVTPQFIESLKQWQGDPFTIMKRRYEELGKRAIGKYLPEMVFYAADLTYHGLLDFKFMGDYMKGHPEGLMIGASRTGKSEVVNRLPIFYEIGNVTEVKNASLVGLIGGVDKGQNGTFRISWGSIPRNHKGLLFLDEISGLHPDIFKHLTGLRSQRKAVIEKIRKGVAPAKTRMLWVGNPRVGEDKRSRSLYDYTNGVQVCLDLFPADEDISRFDFIILVPEPEDYISPLNDDGTLPEEQRLPEELKQLIRWVWSRDKDQVIFDSHVDRYIEEVAKELNKDFGSTVKIIGIEGVKKIARIAASVAACCFSCDSSGDCVVVKKEHVDWTKDFLLRCYDNEIFRMREFVKIERKFTTTNTEVNALVAKYCRKHPMIIKLLLDQPQCPRSTLRDISGIGMEEEFRHLISEMFSNGLIQADKTNVSATRRLRLAVDEFRATWEQKRAKKMMNTEVKSFSDKIEL